MAGNLNGTDIGPVLDRRLLLSKTITAGAIFSAVISGSAAAAVVPAPTKTSNITLVNAFCAAWADAHLHIDLLAARYLADECIIRFMDSTLCAQGRIAATELLRSFLLGNRTFKLDVETTSALGPFVLNLRTDTTYTPGLAPIAAKIGGVFLVRHNKIQEWSDYTIP